MQNKFLQVGKIIERRASMPILEAIPCIRVSIRASINNALELNLNSLRHSINYELAQYVSGGEWTSLSQQKES